MKFRWCLCLLCAVNGIAAIPEKYFPPSGWADYQWEDPGGWETIDVTTAGLPRNDASIDASVAIREILARSEGRRILYFPEGTYYLHTECRIEEGDIQFVGDGIGKTVFEITTKEEIPVHGIVFAGSAEEREYFPEEKTFRRGYNRMESREDTPYEPGDFILVYSPERSPTEKVFWRGQIFKVTDKRGRTHHFDMRSGVDMPLLESVRMWRLFMSENISLEDFTIKRLHKNARESSNIVLEYCYNARVSHVESVDACFSNIRARASRQVIVEHCLMHGAWEASGGWAYGVNFHRATTQSRASHNRAWNLRHGINVSAGANYCIFSYNSSEAPYVSYQDIGVHHGGFSHNILFEGNRGKEIVTDGGGLNRARSDYVFFFRNHATSVLGPQSDLARNYVVAGNVVDAADGLAREGEGHFYVANSAGGIVSDGADSDKVQLPVSLYRSDSPDSASLSGRLD